MPVRARLTAASEALGFAPPVFLPRVEDALQAGAGRGVLFIDAATGAAEPALVPMVAAWAALRPGSEVIMFTPLLDRERELRVAVDLSRSVRSAEVRIMTGADFYCDEVWSAVGATRDRTAREAKLRAEFLEAVRRTGRTLRAESAVLALLHGAACAASVNSAADTPVEHARAGRWHEAPAGVETERKALWKYLRRSGQMPASWLLLVFRVLWYVKLRDSGWSAGQIAHFLGLDSPRHLRLTIRRRLGVGLTELRPVRYDHALDWAAELVTAVNLDLARRPVRALVAALVGRQSMPAASPVHDDHLRREA